MTKPTRQLAAILFSDIVGYTALMGKDEPRALDILRQSRNIQKSMIESHNGKWLKEMGDGVLAQFSSAVNAVQCALKIQEQANAELDAKIRIGIHLGDVTIENEDVFGDGVNIASRLQAIADPGGIYISGSINDAVYAQSGINTRFLAEVELKNVDRLIKTYCLQADWLPVPSATKIREISKKARKKVMYASGLVLVLFITMGGWWINVNNGTEISSIAVLPVMNLSGDSTINMLMVGIHTELRDEIAKIGALRVVSSRSTAKFKNAEMSISEIAKELNVDAVVEPDIFEYGDKVILQARLIKAIPEEQQVWSKSFEESASNVFSIYDDIAMAIAEKSGIQLTQEEQLEFKFISEVNPEAHEAYLTGMSYLYEGDKTSLDRALSQFEGSLDKDPNYAPAYLGMVLTWNFKAMMKYVPSLDARPYIEKFLPKALELDSTSALAHYTQAIIYTWTFWEWEKAGIEFERTIEHDPSNAETRAYYAHFLIYQHRLQEAAEQMEKAMELEPYNNWVHQLYVMYLNNTRQFDKAKTVALKSLEEESGPVASSALWTNYHYTGKYKDAFKAAREVLLERREYEASEKLISGNQEGGYKMAMQRVAEAFEIKKDTSDFPSWRLATLYVRADNQEKALDWLEQAYQEHSQEMPYLSCDPIFDNIADLPRYQAILDSIGLKRIPKPDPVL